MQAKNGKISRSLIAGAAGGLTGSYAMNLFQSLWSTVAKNLSKHQDDRQESGNAGEDATIKTARAISRSVFKHELTEAQKKWAGPAVHYGFGALAGAAYGILAGIAPKSSAGFGTAYGSAVWLVADEIGVPAFGVSQSPSEISATSHVKALASHLVYGFTTDRIRRVLY